MKIVVAYWLGVCNTLLVMKKNLRERAFHLIDYGIISEHDLLIACLNFMSDNNLETMMRAHGLIVDEELEEVEE
jgi:hypothetical protein